MILLYNILLHTLLITGFPVLIIIVLSSQKRRHTFLKRAGIDSLVERFNRDAFSNKDNTQGPIWVHALSVGEVISATPLIDSISEHYPGREIAFSASTKTGFEIANNLFGEDSEMVNEIFYFPYDLPFSINRITKRINPSLVIIVESDIWPNFLNSMTERNTPVFLVNARLSARSFKGYKRIGLFSRKIFSFFSGIAAQTNEDKKRFEMLNIPAGKIAVTGNIKFDQPSPSMDTGILAIIEEEFQAGTHDLTLLAGSTHPGEEEIILKAYSLLRKKHPNLGLIIAPRNPDRASEIEKAFSRHGEKTAMITEFVSGNCSLKRDAVDIIIVNIMGVLGGLYSATDIAFIGGSLVNCGGHNPLEPAAFGKPVVFGPDMSDFALIAQGLVEKKGSFMVNNGEELFETLDSLIMDRGKREQTGKNAMKIFNDNKGAVEKTFTFIDKTERRQRH